jgi:hypothetical protein
MVWGLKSPVPTFREWRKLLANGKGVHREVGFEGSRRQNSDPRNTNCIKGCDIGVSLRDKTKPIAIKRYRSKCGGCGVEAVTLTRGGLQTCPSGTTNSVKDSDGSAEVSRGHSRTAGQSEGPNI